MGKQAKLAVREHRAAEKAREKEERLLAREAAAREKQARKEREREARMAERKRRSVSGAGGSAAKKAKKEAAVVSLVCVCRGPEVDSDPRGFVQCEGGCEQWFHPVCVGEDLAEIEARGEAFKWSCPGCVGRGEVLEAQKRTRSAAAAGGGQGGLCSGAGGLCERRGRRWRRGRVFLLCFGGVGSEGEEGDDGNGDQQQEREAAPPLLPRGGRHLLGARGNPWIKGEKKDEGGEKKRG